MEAAQAWCLQKGLLQCINVTHEVPYVSLQLRARSAAQHPALDLLYPALAALAAFEAAALAAPGGPISRWTAGHADLVRAVPGRFQRCLFALWLLLPARMPSCCIWAGEARSMCEISAAWCCNATLLTV